MAGEFDLQDFVTDVVEESKIRPVVLDFWAGWCGPCRVLGPIIEKLAHEAQGKWRLVKIDTEEHPQIAAQFQIRSIPAVKMVYQGKLIAEFTGALPEAQVRQWLAQHLPESEEDENQDLVDVKSILETGDRKTAFEIVKDAFIENPENEENRLLFGLLLLPDHLDEATHIFEPFVKEGKFNFETEAVQTLVKAKAILEKKEELPEGGHPKTVEALQNGIKALFENRYEEAMDALLLSIQYDRSYADELARKVTVALFKLLTDDHPLAKAKRRAFSMALS